MEGRVGKVRYSFEEDGELYRDVGLAITTNGGSLGSTYQEPGRDMFREFKVTVYKWTWVLRFSWKDLSDER